ncbi:MAG: hypothetical protein QOH29_2058, partial [Actinomycetota bacterium]|nr:hypothetical protein [Actinomycetota bacterium]
PMTRPIGPNVAAEDANREEFRRGRVMWIKSASAGDGRAENPRAIA